MVRILVVGALAACGYPQPAQPGPRDAGRDATDGPTADVPLGAHCANVGATCGSGSTDDCCASAVIAGGTFSRTQDSIVDAAPIVDVPPAPDNAYVGDARVDRYEVTVARFRQFVLSGQGTQARPPAVGAGTHTAIVNSGWDASWNTSLASDTPSLVAALKCSASYQTWSDAPGSEENFPINCVTWYEAMAFCIWDGGYLPTEAEWAYAAMAGAQERAFPWSVPANDPTCDCSYANNGGAAWPTTACSATGANRVGSESPTGDGKWGHADLAGNVAEWVLDYSGAYPTPCTNCANLTPSAQRVTRGGSYADDPNQVENILRGQQQPSARSPKTGFRCARAP